MADDISVERYQTDIGKLTCHRGHPLHGTIKSGEIIADACSYCGHEWEQAWTAATGRTKNMAPEGFKYVCACGVECHFDRSGAFSSGYPYHVKDGKPIPGAGGNCKNPTTVKKVPEWWPTRKRR